MGRIIALGDIHGCSKTFKALLHKGIKLKKSDEVFCLGDYIDRGPDSKGVVDLILDLRAKGYKIHTIRGNHEQLMIDSETDEKENKIWLRNGGEKTLQSFSVNKFSELKTHYQNFFKETKHYLEKDNFIFVHAGLDFSKADIFENKYAMLWTRDLWVSEEKLGGKIIIHGHTIKTLETIIKQLGKNVINIDGGCVYNESPLYGNLVAIDLTNSKFISTPCID